MVTLSQDTYDATLDDIKKLRERNVALEHENKALRLQANSYFDKWAESMGKTNAFDEIVNAVDESANSYELVARIKLEVLKYQKLEREER
ncbi:hypothetical protein RIU93_03920 [Staphylococcus warneri]|uniref:hypothetical protein n=1 Tax=Staphylococcus warneri TaxID=1292 RepID=UPI0011A94BCC|nr:hypothetical protein [Staphylococcus warneri]WNF18894.1 hypothetical protein RIU93_03920 [Staphylococcus warneri]